MVGPVIDAKIGLIQVVRKVRGIVVFFLRGQNRNFRKVKELKLLLNQLFSLYLVSLTLNSWICPLTNYKLSSLSL